MSSIAEKWEELSGQNNWKGLLNPPDLDLRKYLIHYGDMTQVTYDAYNADLFSKHYGSCRYSEANLFSKVGREKGNPYKYEVTKYFYATASYTVPDAFIFKPTALGAWSRESEGKAALGRRDIVVCWRGTIRTLEWVNDLEIIMTPATKIFGDDASFITQPHVHRGFYSIYTSENADSAFNKKSARDQVLGDVKRLVEQYKNEEVSITVCGHSLGASLATLNAIDIVNNGINKTSDGKAFPVTAFVFTCPRTDDQNFKKVCDSTPDLHLLRVTDSPDVVPRVPHGIGGIVGYADVGLELTIDVTKSSYVRPLGELVSWHLLESYLHGIAGTQGVDRDICLINKQLDYLKSEYSTPGFWWVEKEWFRRMMDLGYCWTTRRVILQLPHNFLLIQIQ